MEQNSFFMAFIGKVNYYVNDILLNKKTLDWFPILSIVISLSLFFVLLFRNFI